MPIIDELIYKVGYKTDEKSAAVAIQRAKRIGTVIAGVVTGATAAASGLFALTKQFSNTADSSVKTADKLGLSVEKLQELRFAADQSGIAQGKFDTALQRMVRRVGEAAQGTGSAAKLLEKYGVNAEKLSKMTADEQFLSLAQAFKDSAKEGQGLSDVFKLFDTEGVDIVRMFESGPDAIRELMQQRRDIGGIISEEDARRSEKFNDTINRILIRFKALSQELFSKLLPVFNDLADTFEDYIDKNKELIKSNLIGFVKAATVFFKVLFQIIKVILIPFRLFVDVVKMVAEALGFVASAAVISGIIALGVAVGLLAGSFNKLFKTFTVLRIFSVVLNPIVLAITALTAAIQDLYYFITGKGSIIGDFLEKFRKKSPDDNLSISELFNQDIVQTGDAFIKMLGMTPTPTINITQTNNINESGNPANTATDVTRATAKALEAAAQ